MLKFGFSLGSAGVWIPSPSPVRVPDGIGLQTMYGFQGFCSSGYYSAPIVHLTAFSPVPGHF